MYHAQNKKCEYLPAAFILGKADSVYVLRNGPSLLSSNEVVILFRASPSPCSTCCRNSLGGKLWSHCGQVRVRLLANPSALAGCPFTNFVSTAAMCEDTKHLRRSLTEPKARPPTRLIL